MLRRFSSTLLISDLSKWLLRSQRANLASLSQPETSEDGSIRKNDELESPVVTMVKTPAAAVRTESSSSSLNLMRQNELDAEERFKHMLKSRLDDKNFKSVAYKQDEVNRIIIKLSSVFNMFHLLEAHSDTFSPVNLVNYVKRLTYMLKESQHQLYDKQLPAQIKSQLTKLVVKQAAHLDPYDCYCIFQRAGPLGFNLNDSYTKCIMQLLKFHVNELDITQLVKAKQNIIYLKDHTENLTSTNHYLIELERAIDLSVQIKHKDLESGDSGIKVLKYFSQVLSDANFKAILDFVNRKRRFLSERNLLELEGVLKERNNRLSKSD